MCFQVSEKAGLGTPYTWKMLIIPPPLAAALHRSSHMLLYKWFTYNGGLYRAATRLFTIHIKCLDFHPPRAKGGICVDTKGLSLAHYLLCRAASEGNFWPEPLRNKWLTGDADSSALEPPQLNFKSATGSGSIKKSIAMIQVFLQIPNISKTSLQDSSGCFPCIYFFNTHWQ